METPFVSENLLAVVVDQLKVTRFYRTERGSAGCQVLLC
jgi:hypothetical protein